MRITIPLVAPDKNAGRLRVAVVPRLVPAFGSGLAVAGAGISAFGLKQVLLAMKYPESAGIAIVARGMAEANFPVLVALYFSIIVGGAGLLIFIIRMFVDTTKSAPGVWFILLAGALGLAPVAGFWWAESLFTGALDPHSGGIVSVAETLTLALTAIMFAGAFILLLLLAISVWPVRSLSKPKWGPIAGLLIVEVALIAMAIAFQMRTTWLFDVAMAERLLP